ncbi:MAG: hypothetical protein H8D80_01750 [Proteobacteria bacterium]|nr:hypothetical protein [Pseudomonadota bacterium]
MNEIKPSEFCQEVENTVGKCGSYIESVLLVCEYMSIEPAMSAKMLSLPLIEKIQAEGELANLLPKKSKLPI